MDGIHETERKRLLREAEGKGRAACCGVMIKTTYNNILNHNKDCYLRKEAERAIEKNKACKDSSN